MKNSIILAGLFAGLACSSCSRVIDLKLGNDSGRLAIEANITDSAGVQTITLSRNVPFTDSNTYPPVSGALITVADQHGNSYSFPEGPVGTYTNTAIVGQPGSTYTMTVGLGNETYQATSTMPVHVALDSVTDQPDELNPGADNRSITVHFHDPSGMPNQYNFLVWVNGFQQKNVYVINDQLIDGNDVSLPLLQQRGDDHRIHVGDTVTVQMQCVDNPMYIYWFTLRQQLTSAGGVTPSDPPTNITPVTLGYFSAHTVQTKSIIIR